MNEKEEAKAVDMAITLVNNMALDDPGFQTHGTPEVTDPQSGAYVQYITEDKDGEYSYEIVVFCRKI